MQVFTEDIAVRFHPMSPSPEQRVRMREVNDAAAGCARTLMSVCPNPSRELSLALTKMEEARMWAHAAIGRDA